MQVDLIAFFQVVLIDVTLAGDNAVVVGLAVAGLPAVQRRRAILIGILGATVLRIVLSFVAVSLLAVVGLTLAGGILLMWVCWKMYRELRGLAEEAEDAAARKTLGQAVLQIVLADLSMSLDNVLAVAGAARGHLWVLAAGLTLSVLLMGVAADLLARLLQRQRWIAWVGLATVIYVAIEMIVNGWAEVYPRLAPLLRLAAHP
jgi:YjbE family integral membrane protein